MKPKSTGTKRTASGGSNGKSKVRDEAMQYPYLAVCLDNGKNPASLQIGKLYRVIAPRPGDLIAKDRIRVVDEEGEDYLYPHMWFAPISVSESWRERVVATTP